MSDSVIQHFKLWLTIKMKTPSVADGRGFIIMNAHCGRLAGFASTIGLLPRSRPSWDRYQNATDRSFLVKEDADQIFRKKYLTLCRSEGRSTLAHIGPRRSSQPTVCVCAEARFDDSGIR